MLNHKNKMSLTSLKRPTAIATILIASQALSGCIFAMQPAYQIASLMLDGVNYVSTGKSVSDHAISVVAQKDCAVLRALNGQDICETPDTMVQLDGLDQTLAKSDAWTVTQSKNVISYAQQPVWQPYTLEQRLLTQANNIDEIVAQY